MGFLKVNADVSFVGWWCTGLGVVIWSHDRDCVLHVIVQVEEAWDIICAEARCLLMEMKIVGGSGSAKL